ncbi:MAG: 2-hydroxyacyl-CoA dehydratase [Desulfovibrionaceae bacterium]|nr:2-hydroxyacyl-CoA dehydratase [Desulfovibrionaceae bacterium]
MSQKANRPGESIRIGVPRILGMFETYPFWKTLLTECGLDVVLSAPSTQALYEKGICSVMSDNICFPAKIAHGHVANLLDQDVDRIFYPHVVHNDLEDAAAVNSFNCPIVSAYGEVLRGSMKLGEQGFPPLDSPAVSFRDESLLRKACQHYVRGLDVPSRRFRKAFDAALAAQSECREELVRRGRTVLDRKHDNQHPLIVLAGRPYHADPLIEHDTSKILSELGADVIPADAVSGLCKPRWSEWGALSQWAYPNRVMKAAQWVADQESPYIQLVMLNSFGCGPDAFIADAISDVLASSGKIFTLIKVDDVSNTGSIRLRLRSLIETLRWSPAQASASNGISARKSSVKTERPSTLITPFFSEHYSPLIPSALKPLGYDLHTLPPPDTLSVEYGLRYANNDTCYPAILTVGDIIKAFALGDFDPANTAVAMTQTGGQCRASSYVPTIRRALAKAGYGDVPVYAISTKGSRADEESTIKLDSRRFFSQALHGLLYADAIAHMYHRCAVRERHTGEALGLRDSYLKAGASCLESEPGSLLPLLTEAVAAFNGAIADEAPRPRVGVVGEIYLKYNSFSQMHIVDWLIAQGVEVAIPALSDFFLQYFINTKVNRSQHLAKFALPDILEGPFEKMIARWNHRYEAVLAGFRLTEPTMPLSQKAALASEITSLVNQYGEGWLIPADVSYFATLGISNIISVQPFGCIANHIVAKGIERAIKQHYPSTNMLFIDFDPGNSEVNILNRLHYIIDAATTQCHGATQ